MKLYIKYMISHRCKMAVKEELKRLGLHFMMADLCVVEVMESLNQDEFERLKKSLLLAGLELTADESVALLERMRNVEQFNHWRNN